MNQIIDQVRSCDGLLKSEQFEAYDEKELSEASSLGSELSRLRIEVDSEQTFQEIVSDTILHQLKPTFAAICCTKSSELNKFRHDRKKLGVTRSEMQTLRHQQRKLTTEVAKNAEHLPQVEQYRTELTTLKERDLEGDDGLASNFSNNLFAERERMVHEVDQLEQSLLGFDFSLTSAELERMIQAFEGDYRRTIQNLEVSYDSNY